jgi:hypothetical protein
MTWRTCLLLVLLEVATGLVCIRLADSQSWFVNPGSACAVLAVIAYYLGRWEERRGS